MTHPFYHGLVCGAIAGFLLGLGATFSFCLLCFARTLPRHDPPVLRRRKNRDRLPEVAPIVPAEVGGIEYRFMGATGLEDDRKLGD